MGPVQQKRGQRQNHDFEKIEKKDFDPKTRKLHIISISVAKSGAISKHIQKIFCLLKIYYIINPCYKSFKQSWHFHWTGPLDKLDHWTGQVQVQCSLDISMDIIWLCHEIFLNKHILRKILINEIKFLFYYLEFRVKWCGKFLYKQTI